MSERNNVYAEIDLERLRQDHQWGGPSHDDRHDPRAWTDFIVIQVGKALVENWRHLTDRVLIRRLVRGRLIKIAALSVAGIEAIDRQAEREQS